MSQMTGLKPNDQEVNDTSTFTTFLSLENDSNSLLTSKIINRQCKILPATWEVSFWTTSLYLKGKKIENQS